MEVTHQRLTPAALLQPKAVSKVLNIELCGPQSQSERFRKEKNSLFPDGNQANLTLMHLFFFYSVLLVSFLHTCTSFFILPLSTLIF
jgi:hypothetical protein